MKIARLITKILLMLLMVLSIILTFTVGKNKISSNKITESVKGYEGVISLWQIDSFEGGVGSRKQFLLEVAREFEKEHEGVLVMVSTQTEVSAMKNYEKGIGADLVSFGLGFNVKNANPIDISYGFNGGKVGEKTYATPWCKGGYVIISNPKLSDGNIKEEDEIVVSQGEYTQPLTALLLENITVKNFTVLPPMDAYVKFTSGKVHRLIGTQRDVVRLNRRGMEVKVTPIKNYNDLYQYISVTTKDGIKRYYAEEFVKFLISEKSQKKLNKICMLSEFTGLSFAEEGLNIMNGVKHKKTLSAFTDKNTLKNMQSVCEEGLKSGKSTAQMLSGITFLNT